MSNATTRSQYAYIEVKRINSNSQCVSLCGPTEVLNIIQRNVCGKAESVGNTMKITLWGCDSTFSKAAFVEEISKHGFAFSDAPSSFKDDLIVFSRQVNL